MGVDLGGNLIVGCRLETCIHTPSGRNMREYLTQELGHDPVGEESEYGDGKKIREMFGLDLLYAYDSYAEEELDEPVFIGLSVCQCGNRGEPISGRCSLQDVEKTAQKVKQSLLEKEFTGVMEIAFLLEAS